MNHEDGLERRRGSRIKRGLLIWIALGAGLAVLAWSQTWFTVARIDGAPLAEPAAASGGVAAPPLMALALAALASVAGLALAGLVLRWLLGGLVMIIGGVTIATSVIAMADPVRAVARMVTELTGVSGDASTGRLVEPADLVGTPWPWAAVLAGVLIALAGLAVIATAKRWPSSARRFETRFADAQTGLPVDSVERWDALSGGDDPTVARAEDDAGRDPGDAAPGARGTGSRQEPPRND